MNLNLPETIKIPTRILLIIGAALIVVAALIGITNVTRNMGYISDRAPRIEYRAQQNQSAPSQAVPPQENQFRPDQQRNFGNGSTERGNTERGSTERGNTGRDEMGRGGRGHHGGGPSIFGFFSILGTLFQIGVIVAIVAWVVNRQRTQQSNATSAPDAATSESQNVVVNSVESAAPSPAAEPPATPQDPQI